MADHLPPPDDELDEDGRLVLGDLINRVLDKGVVIAGDVIISVAGIDLIRLELRVLLTAIESEVRRGAQVGRVPGQANADVPVLPRRPRE